MRSGVKSSACSVEVFHERWTKLSTGAALMERRTKGFILAAVILIGVMLLPILGQAPSRGVKLVLVISIDQMRFDYLTRFGSLYKGGLRRLLD